MMLAGGRPCVGHMGISRRYALFFVVFVVFAVPLLTRTIWPGAAGAHLR
jgi:hypothetical protein